MSGSLCLPAGMVQPLLAWFYANARVLPWRSLPTPYRVWVSEIMLQQTRVEAVRPYFARFMDALPDIKALAQADEQTLLKLWEGLGYYSRARNLQKAARIVVQRYDGRLPNTPHELAALPGIGPYTAGAIASIAFGYPAAAVDGNVLRVLGRLTAYEGDVLAPALRAQMARAIEAILPARPGDFNQALMELGALLCLPGARAACGSCPLQGLCEARQRGIQAQLPHRRPKKARKVQQRTVLLLWHDGRVALRRRPPQGLLAGLWEFPCLEGYFEPPALQEALARLGLPAQQLRFAGEARHLFTHVEWQMQGWQAACRDIAAAPPDWVWAAPHELAADYPLPSAYRAYTAQVL